MGCVRSLGGWAALLTVGAMLAACGPFGVNTTPASVSTTIPLMFEPASGANDGNDVLIPVSIGNGMPFYVILDTGSTGLKVTQTALTTYGATSYTTGRSIKASFSGGCVYNGNSAKGPFKIGSIQLPTEYFDIVQPSSSCSSIFANGVLGVRPALVQSSDDPNVQNPMMFMPGNYGSGFILSLWASPPSMTVGLTDPIRQGFNTTPAPVQISPASPNAEYWGPPGDTASENQQGGFPWCFAATAASNTVPRPVPIQTCTASTVMDNGGQQGRIYMGTSAPAWYPVATTTPSAALFTNALVGTPPLGTVIVATMANDPAMTWTLPAAGIPQPCALYNAEQLVFGPTPAQSAFENNTGMSPFLENDVMFDFQKAQLGIRPINPIPSPPPFCSQ
jgi:hypothetical protein